MGIVVNRNNQAAAGYRPDRPPHPTAERRRILMISDHLDQPREQVQVRLMQTALATRGDRIVTADWRRLHNGWPDVVDLSSILARSRHLAQRYRNLARSITRCDVVHIRFSESLGLIGLGIIVGLARYLGRPVVCDIRCHDIEALIESVGRSEKWLLDHCDALVVSSSYHQEMLEGIDIYTEVVVDSVDRSRFIPRGITDVQPHLISVRPLEVEYNVSALIKAFAMVKQKYPRAELTIVGDGARRPVIQQLIDDARGNGITLVGQVDHDEVARLMSRADLYVNPAGLDSVSVSLLEALASGLPVVSTDVGGIREVVKDGENGLLTPPFSPPALADRIIELVDKPDLAAKLSSRAPWSLGGTPWLEGPSAAWHALYDRLNAFRSSTVTA